MQWGLHGPGRALPARAAGAQPADHHDRAGYTDFPISLFNAAVFALIAIGLNVVIGQAGLLDLGYVGFFAIGAYTAALLSSPDSELGVRYPWLVIVPIAMVVTMISGVILGTPTLRLRGDYLAIVTLGFGEIVRLLADNVDPLRGNRGFQNIARPGRRLPRRHRRSSARPTPSASTGSRS